MGCVSSSTPQASAPSRALSACSAKPTGRGLWACCAVPSRGCIRCGSCGRGSGAWTGRTGRGWWRARRSSGTCSVCTGLCFSFLWGVDALTGGCRERYAANLQLLSDGCDLTVPGSALGWVDLDDGIVGLAGTVSSLIGLRGAWEKTA